MKTSRVSTILLQFIDINKNTIPLPIVLYIVPHWLWKV